MRTVKVVVVGDGLGGLDLQSVTIQTHVGREFGTSVVDEGTQATHSRLTHLHVEEVGVQTVVGALQGLDSQSLELHGETQQVGAPLVLGSALITKLLQLSLRIAEELLNLLTDHWDLFLDVTCQEALQERLQSLDADALAVQVLLLPGGGSEEFTLVARTLLSGDASGQLRWSGVLEQVPAETEAGGVLIARQQRDAGLCACVDEVGLGDDTDGASAFRIEGLALGDDGLVRNVVGGLNDSKDDGAGIATVGVN